MANDHDVRRAAIRRIIASERVATQEALRKRIFDEGFDVTQATLSRDLAQLGARRVSLPEGGTVYELDDVRVPGGLDALESQRGIVTAVIATDSLVLAKTLPGAASAVALAIDRARLDEIAGTIAGDDTIFIAPSKGVPAARSARQLTSIWLEGTSR